MAHRDELEAGLAGTPAPVNFNAPGRGYLVLGTVELKVWKKGLGGGGTNINEMLEHTAGFKKYFDLDYDPGGWRPADEV